MEPITILHHRLNIIIAVIIICAFICVSTIVFYRPAQKFDTSGVKALEQQRQAIVDLRMALEKSVDKQKENIAWFNQRDSIINSKLDINIAEIKKVRNNEKIIAITHYNSADLTRAFAELEK